MGAENGMALLHVARVVQTAARGRIRAQEDEMTFFTVCYRSVGGAPVATADGTYTDKEDARLDARLRNKRLGSNHYFVGTLTVEPADLKERP